MKGIEAILLDCTDLMEKKMLFDGSALKENTEMATSGTEVKE
jgi:hypothetical protein